MSFSLPVFAHADSTDKLLMVFGFLGAIGNGLILPLIAVFSNNFFNNYGSSTPSSHQFIQAINKNALFMLCLACGSLVTAFLEGYCWTRTAERQTSKLRLRYLKAVLRQDVEYFDLRTSSSAEVINCISNDSSVIQEFIGEKVPKLVSALSTFLSGYAVAFLLSWRLAIVISPMVILVIAPTILYGRKLMSLAGEMSKQFDEASLIAEQAISSVRTVYSFVAEKRTIAKYSAALDETVRIGLKQGLAKGLAIGCFSITYSIWAFIFWYGSRLVMYHGVKGGTVFAVGVSILIAGLALGQGIPNLRYFSEASTAAAKIMEVIKRTPKIDIESEEGEVIENFIGNVEFRNVEFAYPSRPESLVLNDFSLKVSAGMTVALVGGSGAGKSTVIALLERFYDPINGEILLDGLKICKLKLKWLRSQMGLVSQEPALFATSIKENILFGKADASMEEIISAAKVANVHDFISQLPQKYDTQVGELGVQISGGQKQRIAIARALIKSPKILLLDEATSALDTESERVVQAALASASVGRTTIIVAHRLSTIRNADSIAVMQSGKVMEIGSHDELIRNCDGLYSSLVQLQNIASVHNKEHFHLRQSSNSLSSPTFETKESKESFTNNDNCAGSDLKKLEKTPVPSFRRLIALNKPEWKQGVIGTVSAMAIGAFEPMFALTMGSMISIFLTNDHNQIKSKTRMYSLIFVMMSVLNFAINGLQHYSFGAMGEYLTKRVRERMLSKILTFEVGWFDEEENSTGAICSKLARDANVTRSLVGDRMSLLIETASTVAITFTLGLIFSWRLGLVMIAVQPLMIITFYIHKVLLTNLSSKAIKFQEESSKLANEAVSNIRTITAFASQERILDMFKTAQKVPRDESIRQSWFAGATFSASSFIMVSVWGVDFWYAGVVMSQGLIDTKALLQTFFLLIMTARVISEAGTRTSDIAKGADAVSSVFSILDRNTRIEPDEPQGYKPESISGDVEFKGVEFSYPARPDVLVFKGLSICVEAGKSTALVGHSGCGKSSIISLIQRFYDASKGTITIDGEDIKTYNLRSLRRHIGLVSQEPVLFAGSIRENISYGVEGATEAEVESAARAANAHEFISSFESGYDTNCGHRGVQLSGGQKQRIAIARAMLKNPGILLLDEATSALDGRSEKAVQGALDRLMVQRTSVVVAHRLSTIKDCDLIVVLEKGVVVESGTHDSLLMKGASGCYYGLVNLQHGENET